jgi:L-2-hydroxyglutarate oxidase
VDEGAVSTHHECDVVIVGAGIVGLATAREISRRHPALRLLILEKERTVAAHQSGHNSGVVHAGVYYEPGSLKARLCVEGARLLHEYCAARDVPVQRSGKLIVAATQDELPALEVLHARGRANGVPGLRRIDGRRIADLEPHARGVAALHSPTTSVVDYGLVARRLADDVVGDGHQLLFGTEVLAANERRGGVEIRHRHGTVRARSVIACAGLWSDRLAVASGGDADPRIVPFRGAYAQIKPNRRDLVRGMIYPVPDPRLPFLGVHLTRHIDGAVTLGPTALPVGARDGYRLRQVRRQDLAEMLAWPGTWRMAWRFRRAGIAELLRAAWPARLVAEATRYVPALRPGDVVPAEAGVRAQAVGRDGTLIDDFVFSEVGRALHVRNAPSPAATACLAIARRIADRFEAGVA